MLYKEALLLLYRHGQGSSSLQNCPSWSTDNAYTSPADVIPIRSDFHRIDMMVYRAGLPWNVESLNVTASPYTRQIPWGVPSCLTSRHSFSLTRCFLAFSYPALPECPNLLLHLRWFWRFLLSMCELFSLMRVNQGRSKLCLPMEIVMVAFASGRSLAISQSATPFIHIYCGTWSVYIDGHIHAYATYTDVCTRTCTYTCMYMRV